MTRPTITEPPTTKLPNASMTLPAKPFSSTSRVTDTFSARRNSVAMSRNDGKIEKSRTRRVDMLGEQRERRQRDVGDEQEVEQRGGQRHHHHHDDADDGRRDRDLPDTVRVHVT